MMTSQDNLRRLFGSSMVNTNKIINLDRHERLPPLTLPGGLLLGARLRLERPYLLSLH
jgi:hypothetical protein